MTAQKPIAFTLDLCLTFFRSLHVDGMAATTITSLKSAISRPILYGFNVALTSNLVSRLLKACANLRPQPRPGHMSRSLDGVSELAASTGVDRTDLTTQLYKTVFLSLPSLGR